MTMFRYLFAAAWLWCAYFTVLPVHAATASSSSKLALGRTSPNTAQAGIAGGSSGDFQRMLGGTYTPGAEGALLMRDLLKMPFKPADIAELKGLITPKNIARGLLGGVGAYAAGEALELLIKEACVRGMGGTLMMAPDSPLQECVPAQPSPQSDGFEYRPISWQSSTSTWYSSRQQACQAAVNWLMANAGPHTYAIYSCPATGSAEVRVTRTIMPSGEVQQNYAGESLASRAGCAAGQYIWTDGTCHADPQVQDVTWRDVTRPDAETKLENAIKATANATKAANAIKDYMDKGGKLEVENPTITGPASSAPTSSDTTNVTNTPTGPVTTTTTTTTTTSYTYNGPTVTARETTTTTTRDAAGNVTSSSTTEGDPAPDNSGDDSFSDSPLPPVPDLYERKYPAGMEGIWNQYKDQLKNTSLAQLATQLMPNVGSTGTCPSWPLNLDLAEWAAYGTRDVAPPCWIWDVAKAILILSALLLARALIFGG